MIFEMCAKETRQELSVPSLLYLDKHSSNCGLYGLLVHSEIDWILVIDDSQTQLRSELGLGKSK